jgi:hypothetical protein
MSFPASHRSPCRPGAKGRLESDLIVRLITSQLTELIFRPPTCSPTCVQSASTNPLETLPTLPTPPLVDCRVLLLLSYQSFKRSRLGQVRMLISRLLCTLLLQCRLSPISRIELMSSSLVTAARTSVVLYRQALNVGDLAAAETHRMDIEVVRYVLYIYRHDTS